MSEIAYKNTDRELYREPAESEGLSYYANSIHVTKEGLIGMNVGGFVIVLPIQEWHEAAKRANPNAYDYLYGKPEDLEEKNLPMSDEDNKEEL